MSKEKPKEKPKEKRVARWYFGGLAGATAACFTHPLDLIKVLLQTYKGKDKPSIVKITKDIVKRNGVLGLYSGLSAAVCRQLTYSTTRFGIYEVAKQNLKSESFQAKVGMAGVAGFMGGIVGTPSDMVNVRMQNDMRLPPEKRRNYKHAIDGLIRVSKEEGTGKLFSGWAAASSRAVLMTIGQLSFYDQVKQVMLASGLFQDNVQTHFVSSATAGALSTFITQPLDVVKTKLMNAKAGEYRNIFHCMAVTAKDGPLAFYKGFLPALVRITPTTVLVFIFYEQMRINFGYIVQEK